MVSRRRCACRCISARNVVLSSPAASRQANGSSNALW